jgi:hypothetical protein
MKLKSFLNSIDDPNRGNIRSSLSDSYFFFGGFWNPVKTLLMAMSMVYLLIIDPNRTWTRRGNRRGEKMSQEAEKEEKKTQTNQQRKKRKIQNQDSTIENGFCAEMTNQFWETRRETQNAKSQSEFTSRLALCLRLAQSGKAGSDLTHIKTRRLWSCESRIHRIKSR